MFVILLLTVLVLNDTILDISEIGILGSDIKHFIILKLIFLRLDFKGRIVQ